MTNFKRAACVPLLGLLATLAACSASTTRNQFESTDTERVRANADRALATCGHGNVAEVSIDGFRCKKADGSGQG